MKLAIRIDPRDNVATVTDTLFAGEQVALLDDQGREIARLAAATDLPLPYHKLALEDLPQGAEVIKYGEIIGHSSQPIRRGEWVHVHNVESATVP